MRRRLASFTQIERPANLRWSRRRSRIGCVPLHSDAAAQRKR